MLRGPLQFLFDFLLATQKAEAIDVFIEVVSMARGILLRRRHGSNMPLVRLMQAKNKKKKEDMLQVISTLGVTCSSATATLDAFSRAEEVLGWLCLLVSEQAGPDAFSLGKFSQPRTAVNVSVELVLLESIPRNETLPTLRQPKFLQQTPEELATFGSVSYTYAPQ